MLALTLIAVCVMLLAAAFLGAYFAVARRPLPPIRAEIFLPAPDVSRQVAAPVIEPIPQNVLDYIDEESEEHARIVRRHRARALKAELGTWDAAFHQLQREDGFVETMP